MQKYTVQELTQFLKAIKEILRSSNAIFTLCYPECISNYEEGIIRHYSDISVLYTPFINSEKAYMDFDGMVEVLYSPNMGCLVNESKGGGIFCYKRQPHMVV